MWIRFAVVAGEPPSPRPPEMDDPTFSTNGLVGVARGLHLESEVTLLAERARETNLPFVVPLGARAVTLVPGTRGILRRPSGKSRC